MDKKNRKYIVIGWFAAMVINQFLRYRRQKKELEELEKINKLTDDFCNNLMESVHESALKRFNEEISKNQAETDKLIKDTIDVQSETEKIFKGLDDGNNSIQCN